MRDVTNLTPPMSRRIPRPSAVRIPRPGLPVIPGMAPEAIPTRGIVRVPVSNGGSPWMPGVGGLAGVEMPTGAMRDVMMVAVGALAAALLLKRATRKG